MNITQEQVEIWLVAANNVAGGDLQAMMHFAHLAAQYGAEQMRERAAQLAESGTTTVPFFIAHDIRALELP